MHYIYIIYCSMIPYYMLLKSIIILSKIKKTIKINDEKRFIFVYNFFYVIS